MRMILRNVVLASFSMACVFAQQQIVSQFADGASWQSVLVVTNTTSLATVASMTFFQDSGSSGGTTPWNPTFLESGINAAAISLPAGSSQFLHTPGTSPVLAQGWVQMNAGTGVTAYVIYTYTGVGVPKQDATAPALTAATRFLLSFDNTAGLVTTMALVNPNPVALTISANFRTSDGVVSQGSIQNIPANGHMAFVMPTQFSGTGGQNGLAEFYSTSGSFSMIALRAHSPGPLSFTAVPVSAQSGSPIILNSGGGGGSAVPAGDIAFAGFSIGKSTGTTGNSEMAGGLIAAYTPAAWNAPYSGQQFDKCIVYDVTYSGSTYPAAPTLSLDAGKLTLTGPGLSGSVIVPELNIPGSIGPIYSLPLSSGSLVGGGTYQLAAAGGTQVEAFNASATLPNNFATNASSINTIIRANPLVITWTGSGFENVIITAEGTVLGAGSTHQVLVTCVVSASLGSYAVPAEALMNLPAISGPLSGIGSLAVTTSPAITGTISSQSSTSTSLTPNLVGGGKTDYGSFAPYFTVTQTVTIQ